MSLNLLLTTNFFMLLCVLYATIIFWLELACVRQVSFKIEVSFSVVSPLYVKVSIVGGGGGFTLVADCVVVVVPDCVVVVADGVVVVVLNFFLACFRSLSRLFLSYPTFLAFAKKLSSCLFLCIGSEQRRFARSKSL